MNGAGVGEDWFLDNLLLEPLGAGTQTGGFALAACDANARRLRGSVIGLEMQ